MSTQKKAGLNRREFFQHGGMLGLAAGMAGGLTGANQAAQAQVVIDSSKGPSPGSRPNVVVICSDDHRQGAMSCMGDPYIQTPHLDQLASDGVLFENGFCVAGVCSPNRVALLTGKYAFEAGGAQMVWYNETFHAQAKPFPALLQAAGYHTGHIGKWHIGDGHVPKPGYDFWAGFQWVGNFFDQPFWFNGVEQPTEGFSDDVMADIAADYIHARAQASSPFCLYVGLKSPHLPFGYPPRHENALDGVDIPKPDSFDEDYSVTGRPTEIRDSLININTFPGGIQAFGTWENYIKSYYRSTMAIDDAVGRIVAALDEAGVADNTIVIYTTDQGYNLGEHQLCEKHYAYEETMRIPLIVHYPGRIEGGGRPNDIALNIDIAPTVLDYCGVTVPGDMTGKSWKPLFDGSGGAWREDFLFEELSESDKVITQLAVRTQEHKLITYPGRDLLELYDLAEDPKEMRNVAEDPAYATVRENLESRLGRLTRETGWRPHESHAVMSCWGLGPVPESETAEVEKGLLYASFDPQPAPFRVGENTYAWQPFDAQPNTNYALHDTFGSDAGNYLYLAVRVERLTDFDPFTILRYVPFRPIKAFLDGKPLMECDAPGWEATLNPPLTDWRHVIVVRFPCDGPGQVQLRFWMPEGAVRTS